MNNPWPSQPWPQSPEVTGPLAAVIQQLDRDILLQQWQQVANRLEAFKAHEAELRAACVKAFFGTPAEGTNNLELGRGYKLKCVGKINYNLGGSTEVVGALEAIAAVNDEGKFIAERLVKWEPKLSISEYRKLPGQFKALIDKVLTTKPGSPQLEIIEPKDAK